MGNGWWWKGGCESCGGFLRSSRGLLTKAGLPGPVQPVRAQARVRSWRALQGRVAEEGRWVGSRSVMSQHTSSISAEPASAYTKPPHW